MTSVMCSPPPLPTIPVTAPCVRKLVLSLLQEQHSCSVFKTLEKTHEEEKPQVNRSSEEHLMEAAADAEKQSCL